MRPVRHCGKFPNALVAPIRAAKLDAVEASLTLLTTPPASSIASVTALTASRHCTLAAALRALYAKADYFGLRGSNNRMLWDARGDLGRGLVGELTHERGSGGLL